MTDVLKDKDTKRKCNEIMEAGNESSIQAEDCQGWPAKHKKIRRDKDKVSEGVWTSQQLDFGLLAYRIV